MRKLQLESGVSEYTYADATKRPILTMAITCIMAIRLALFLMSEANLVLIPARPSWILSVCLDLNQADALWKNIEHNNDITIKTYMALFRQNHSALERN